MRGGDPRLIHHPPEPMAAEGQRYAGPDACICEARASACVSTYSRMLVNLPSRIVMAKIQSSTNVLFVALIFPLAKPTTRTRSPCATNSRGSVDVSIDLDAVSSKFASPACPRCVPASGQSLPGMIHSMSSATSASRASLSPRPIAAKEVLHGLDVLLNTHGNFSISHGSNWGSSMRATSRTNIGLGVFMLNPSETATNSRNSQCTRLKFFLPNDPADEVQFNSG